LRSHASQPYPMRSNDTIMDTWTNPHTS
jgi:hypothetical protein